MKSLFTAFAIALMMKAGFAQNKIIYSSSPFTDSTVPEKEFKANTPIYGRILLDKPLKQYCSDPEKKYGNVPSGYMRLIGITPDNKRDEDGNDVYDETLIMTYQLYLTAQDLEKNYIDFDVMPSLADATSPYADWTSFYYSFAKEDLNLGKKLHFGIKLYKEYNQSNADIMELDADGDLYIDYSASTPATQRQWFDQCKKAQNEAKNNAAKKIAAAMAESVKSLPLPNCFSIAGGTGYKDPKYSKAAIIAILKQMQQTNEIVDFRFDKPDGTTDFRSLADASTGLPTCKMGNHVFYYAFKAADGSYRFAGGVLKMDYEGYGKYGAAYVYSYSPIKGDEKYPVDEQKKAQGIYSVFYFDGSKLKK